MKVVLALSILCTALMAHQVEIVRDHLQPRVPEWRPVIVESYPNGAAKGIYFYEDLADDKELAVKRVLLSESGGVVVEYSRGGSL